MRAETIFIDTNSLPHEKSAGGELTEILNGKLAGAKNVFGALRWIDPGQEFQAEALDKHQLIYIMQGQGRIRLESKDYDVRKGAGVYLGPSEAATIQAANGASIKLFHLIVPRIPR